ncbi:MAG: hypothetical protein MJZ90_09995 [Bacteroidales bacterium]|nr:hypothetical protein [Bacteroidales bacterium]
MNILTSIDIEDAIREALSDKFAIYCRPLPANFKMPCILITAVGGRETDTISTFLVSVDARAKTDADAYDYIRKAVGAIIASANADGVKYNHASVNSLAKWGNDPARPDIKLCTATLEVIAHKQTITI